MAEKIMATGIKMPEALIDQAVELYISGKTVRQISNEVGYTRETITIKLKDRGVYDGERDKHKRPEGTHNHVFRFSLGNAITPIEIENTRNEVRIGDIVEVIRPDGDNGNHKILYVTKVARKTMKGLLATRKGWCRPIFVPYKCIRLKSVYGGVRTWREVR